MNYWVLSSLTSECQSLINKQIERVWVWSKGRGGGRWSRGGEGDKKRQKQAGRTLYLAMALSPSVFLSWIIIVWQHASCRAEVAGMCYPLPSSTGSISEERVAKYCNNCCRLACHSHRTLVCGRIFLSTLTASNGDNVKGREFWITNCCQQV